MMDAVILGNGSSGQAAAALAARLGYSVTVLDGDDAFPSRVFTVAIVSPGVPLNHPWQVACRAQAIPIISEVQFGVQELQRRGWRLLAVTGSKGKSSVVKLLASAFGGVACGNYGLPVSRVAIDAERGGIAIIEVSSFMMETTSLPADTFESAAVLNLQEDHLDRHETVEAYHALKQKLLAMARNGIAPVATPTVSSSLFSGSYFDNEILRANATAAVTMMRAGGLDDTAIRKAFVAFQPLPHRFETVAEIDGVRYVDDSKATSIAALRAGLRMCSPHKVRLIAGGLAKGDDPHEAIMDLTFGVKKVYTIGRCAGIFMTAWSTSVECELCQTLERAVESARRDAVSGEIVLLSPGTASFDQFKSFEERGEVFARLVKKGK